MRIYIKVTAGASKSEIIRISEGEYRAKLTAPPTGGQANRMLCEILADYFNVSRSCVSIAGGKSARKKIIDIDNA